MPGAGDTQHDDGSREAIERLSLLARAGEVLASSLDYEETLARLAQLVVPDLAAWCTIDMVGADGTLERLTVAHADPDKLAWARQLEERYRPDPNHPEGAAVVAATGKPSLVPEIPDEMLAVAARDDPELLQIFRELGLTSYMSVPLIVRDHVLGVLTLVADDPEGRYDERDLDLALELARRAAVAVDNARLFREAEAAQERYRQLFDRNPLPMWVYDFETLAFLAVNEAAVRHYGYSRDEFLALTITDIRPEEEVPGLLRQLERERGSPVSTVWRHRKKGGTLIDVEITAGPVVFDGHEAALVLAHDVTDRRQLEEQLAQTQKMEAIGRLAGGIAHDFNNLLLVIAGYSSMLLTDPATSERREVQEIANAAEHASALTRQLLAFSRRQVLQPRVIDLNGVITQMEPMLRRIIGEDVEIGVHLTPQPATVEADPGALERVILNLVVNARDAMPTGGELTIETANVELDADFATTHLEGQIGPNVMLTVSDTGHGMSAEVRERLFEPFFTTKGAGAGTGLGLASVFGVVKQSGGSIYVYSEEGEGTTFKIYMPSAAEETRPAPEREARRAPHEGAETVLLIEDDEPVRELVRTMLESRGYRVLEAPDADTAEALCADESVDLLLTDVVMPGASGRELAERLVEMNPGMRVLFMSGYSDEAVYRRGVITPESAFVEKPFTHEMLLQKVREVLDA